MANSGEQRRTAANSGEQRRTAANSGEQDNVEVQFLQAFGKLFSDLKTGANLSGAKPLLANGNICNRGVSLFGAGFIVNPKEAKRLGLGSTPNTEKHIRNYRNGKDITQTSRNVMAIDLFGLTVDEVQKKFPAIYQWVSEKVRPERELNKRESRKRNWWLFGETNPKLRHQLYGLPRYIATVETMKHRTFQFLDADILPDNKLVNIALSDAFYLGSLSSRLHAVWALAAGSRLGVGNDAVYVKTTCFETFPFPATSEENKQYIRNLAERLDAHRKQQQAQHPELTLTGMYNVLEKLRSAQPLNAKEKNIHEQGLVSILRELHDDLDRAVFAAYGWDDLAEKLVGLPGATTPLPDKSEAQAEAEEELLRRLVALNAERAAEEAQGHIRWLRPDYQNPGGSQQSAQQEAKLGSGEASASKPLQGKQTWPKGMREQIAAVRTTLGKLPLTPDAIAAHFKTPKKALPFIKEALDALEELGMVYQESGAYKLS